MLKLLLLMSLFIAVQGGHGETCYSTEYSWWFDSWYTTSFYCDDGCCGEYGSQYCCTYHESHDHDDKDTKNDHDDDHHVKGGWTVASIVGVSLGGMVALLCVVLIIICAVKACKAGNKKVVNVQPAPIGMHVWATSSGNPPTVQTFTQPPPYAPAGEFQSHPPAYHPPPGPARYEEKQSTM